MKIKYQIIDSEKISNVCSFAAKQSSVTPTKLYNIMALPFSVGIQSERFIEFQHYWVTLEHIMSTCFYVHNWKESLLLDLKQDWYVHNIVKGIGRHFLREKNRNI